MVGTNGSAATLHDDFSGSPSSEATGFSIDRWGRNANASVDASGGALHLRASAATSAAVTSASPWTTVDAMRPAPYDTWQADLAIVANPTAVLHLGGSFLSDGTAGGPNDATGDILSNVVLSSRSASVRIMRCADPDCLVTPLIAAYALPASPAHPLGLGTVHTVSQRWNPTRRVFTYRLDDGAPFDVDYFTTRTTALPRLPARYFGLGFPVSGPAGTAGSAEATVRNVRFAR